MRTHVVTTEGIGFNKWEKIYVVERSHNLSLIFATDALDAEEVEIPFYEGFDLAIKKAEYMAKEKAF